MAVLIDSRGVRTCIEDFYEAMGDIGFDAVESDFKNDGSDDPRASHLYGCWQNCRNMDAMNEIAGYMNRLAKEIATLRPGEKRQMAEKYWKRTVDNLKKCVREAR